MTMERADHLDGAGGARLFARWLGEGPTIVTLHGGPGASHDYLRPQFDRLATGRTLLYYDQRGGGRSPVAREVPLGARAHVEDLEAIVREHVGGPATLLGFSWGGLLSLLFTLANPDLVARLALVAPAPIFPSARAEFDAEFERRQAAPAIAAARAELSRSGLREHDPDAFWRRAFELSVAGYFRDPVRARNLTPFRVSARVQHAVWESVKGADLRPRLGEIRVPVLVLHGRHDPVPLAASEELVSRLPDGRLEIFDDSGHALYAEETEKFVRVLDGFLPKDRV